MNASNLVTANVLLQYGVRVYLYPGIIGPVSASVASSLPVGGGTAERNEEGGASRAGPDA